MPPKARTNAAALTRPGAAGGRKDNLARTVINEITSSENRSVVTAIAFFATGVAFLHSSWGDILLPPL